MSTISSLSEVRRFRFDGSRCLYLDPNGRRVVADAEGPGECRVDFAEAPLLFLRDEKETDAFPRSFENSLSVLAIGPGEVQITLAQGPPPMPIGQIESEEYEGAGWVLSCEGPLWIDDRHEEAPSPGGSEGPNLMVPFFRRAKGDRLLLSPARVRCERVDAWRIDDLAGLKARGWQVQNVSKIVPLESAFSDGTGHFAPVASHLNAATWRCRLPADNLGIRLRKTYDRFHGRQRARVFIDDEFAGWWYEPVENRDRRWGVTEFGIAPALTHGKKEIQITIDPPAGSPLWSVSEFEVFALISEYAEGVQPRNHRG